MSSAVSRGLCIPWSIYCSNFSFCPHRHLWVLGPQSGCSGGHPSECKEIWDWKLNHEGYSHEGLARWFRASRLLPSLVT